MPIRATQYTQYACYLGYITQAIVINPPPAACDLPAGFCHQLREDHPAGDGELRSCRWWI